VGSRHCFHLHRVEGSRAGRVLAPRSLCSIVEMWVNYPKNGHTRSRIFCHWSVPIQYAHGARFGIWSNPPGFEFRGHWIGDSMSWARVQESRKPPPKLRIHPLHSKPSIRNQRIFQAHEPATATPNHHNRNPIVARARTKSAKSGKLSNMATRAPTWMTEPSM